MNLSSQSILKETSPGCSLEGLMLRLKLQYFGHLMQRVDSLEKILMLGGIGLWCSNSGFSALSTSTSLVMLAGDCACRLPTVIRIRSCGWLFGLCVSWYLQLAPSVHDHVVVVQLLSHV